MCIRDSAPHYVAHRHTRAYTWVDVGSEDRCPDAQLRRWPTFHTCPSTRSTRVPKRSHGMVLCRVLYSALSSRADTIRVAASVSTLEHNKHSIFTSTVTPHRCCIKYIAVSNASNAPAFVGKARSAHVRYPVYMRRNRRGKPRTPHSDSRMLGGVHSSTAACHIPRMPLAYRGSCKETAIIRFLITSAGYAVNQNTSAAKPPAKNVTLAGDRSHAYVQDAPSRCLDAHAPS